MMKLPPNLYGRRFPTQRMQAKAMSHKPVIGLNFGGVRTGAAKRGAGFGRTKQRNAPDATSA